MIKFPKTKLNKPSPIQCAHEKRGPEREGPSSRQHSQVDPGEAEWGEEGLRQGRTAGLTGSVCLSKDVRWGPLTVLVPTAVLRIGGRGNYWGLALFMGGIGRGYQAR